MEIVTEQVFVVNSTELNQAPATPLQRAFAMPVAAMESEEPEITSICSLPQASMRPPARAHMCRLCAAVTELAVPIFEGEGLLNGLADKIHQHLPIQVSQDDVLPVVMCYQCTSTLLAWHELVLCSVQADTVMRERYNLHFSASQQQQQQPNIQVSQTQTAEEKAGLRLATHPRPPTKRESVQLEIKTEEDVGAGGDSDDSEDRPLVELAVRREAEYRAFYGALVRLREHIAEEHAAAESEGSSEDGEGVAVAGGGADEYDDLSHRNMRRDRLDPQTRAELSGARVREGGRVRFACAQCGRRLASAHTYIFHRRIHTGERPCVCHVCGKQFRAPHGLQRHVAETHERRRRPACRRCGRSFANSQNLKQHMRIHTGERPYECKRCGKRFAQSGSLHAHGKTHEAARPHACAECGAGFRLRGGLARHRLRHSGERPHACGECARRFRTRHEAAAHRAAHGDARPHACPLCPAAFRQRRALRHHQRRLHQTDLELPPPPPGEPAPLY